eukprot:scaffold1242_cov123-Cylindrotheca_fusiformis.AAC.14
MGQKKPLNNPKAPSRGKQPKRKSSPYFDTTKQRSRKNQTKSSGCSSWYFSHSPSSTYGSLQALGPLVYTWTPNNMTAATVFCQRSISCSRVCSSCAPVVSSSLTRFHRCPLFSKYIDENDWIEMGKPLSCAEIMGKVIEKGVRHLCTNGCFLAAYAPSREWVFFRKTLRNISDEPLDGLLSSWTCKLVDNVKSTEKPNRRSLNHERRTEMTPLSSPRVQFFSAVDQQSYSHSGEAIRALGLDKWFFGEKLVPRANAPVSPRKIRGARLRQPSRTRNEVLASNGVDSPLGLLEELFGEDPWRLLLCTILLNRTRRSQVDAVLHDFIEFWPTPEALLVADVEEVCNLIKPLGMKGRRSRGILRFCREYLDLVQKKRTEGIERPACHLSRAEVSSLYYCGEYAADAYQIFIHRDLTNLHPNDKALKAYAEWKKCGGARPLF